MDDKAIRCLVELTIYKLWHSRGGGNTVLPPPRGCHSRLEAIVKARLYTTKYLIRTSCNTCHMHMQDPICTLCVRYAQLESYMHACINYLCPSISIPKIYLRSRQRPHSDSLQTIVLLGLVLVRLALLLPPVLPQLVLLVVSSTNYVNDQNANHNKNCHHARIVKAAGAHIIAGLASVSHDF